MEESIGSVYLEDRVVQFSTDNGSYFLRVYNRTSMEWIVDESITLDRDELTNRLTHIPEQQITGLR